MLSLLKYQTGKDEYHYQANDVVEVPAAQITQVEQMGATQVYEPCDDVIKIVLDALCWIRKTEANEEKCSYCYSLQQDGIGFKWMGKHMGIDVAKNGIQQGWKKQ